MAVYKQIYKRYDGPITDTRWRFAILPRYSFQSIFEFKGFTIFYVLCFVPWLVGLILLYLRANADILTSVGLNIIGQFPIDSSFFRTLFQIQTFLVFIMAMFVGPGLVSPDLTNNALPLYLSRPFTRHEYVIGKLCVILTLASLMTWVPGLLVYFVQCSLEPGWMALHYRIAAAIFVGSWLWILLVSLLAVAISAWVKWKPVAAATMFGVFFVTAAFGEMTNEVLDLQTKWGMLINITEVMNMIWTWLFTAVATYRTLPVAAAFASVTVYCLAAVGMLWKKIRACEVVR